MNIITDLKFLFNFLNVKVKLIAMCATQDPSKSSQLPPSPFDLFYEELLTHLGRDSLFENQQRSLIFY